MYYNKEKYEQLINESPLFKIDKQEDPTMYEREKFRIKEYLYCYLLGINEKKYEPYGYEILKVSENCINAFDPSKGLFLHYFNAAWKMEQKHIFGDEEFEEQYRGLKLKELDIRKVRQIRKAMRDMGYDISSPDFYAKTASLLDISENEVKELLKISLVSMTGGKISETNDGEVDFIEQITDIANVEDVIIQRDNIRRILEIAQETFDVQQERSKHIISDYITTITYPIIKDLNICFEYSFLSPFAKYMFDNKNAVLSKRDIAARYNKNEASVNRTIKNYLVLLSKNIEKRKIL